MCPARHVLGHLAIPRFNRLAACPYSRYDFSCPLLRRTRLWACSNFGYTWSPNRKGPSGDEAWTCQPVRALFLTKAFPLGGAVPFPEIGRPLPATSNCPATKTEAVADEVTSAPTVQRFGKIRQVAFKLNVKCRRGTEAPRPGRYRRPRGHSSSSHTLLQHPAPVPCVIAVYRRVWLARAPACLPFVQRDDALSSGTRRIDAAIRRDMRDRLDSRGNLHLATPRIGCVVGIPTSACLHFCCPSIA